jgi:hypothetical protein
MFGILNENFSNDQEIMKIRNLKTNRKWLAVIMAVIMVCVMMSACGGSGGGASADNSIAGTWNYEDTEYDISASYVFNEDGTGTNYINVGGQEVTYELKYEYKDDHLFITYVNNETFTEDDVFDFEVTFEDEQTIVLKDTAGGDEITYVRQ